jgi:hypothetical protein
VNNHDEDLSTMTSVFMSDSLSSSSANAYASVLPSKNGKIQGDSNNDTSSMTTSRSVFALMQHLERDMTLEGTGIEILLDEIPLTDEKMHRVRNAAVVISPQWAECNGWGYLFVYFSRTHEFLVCVPVWNDEMDEKNNNYHMLYQEPPSYNAFDGMILSMYYGNEPISSCSSSSTLCIGDHEQELGGTGRVQRAMMDAKYRYGPLFLRTCFPAQTFTVCGSRSSCVNSVHKFSVAVYGSHHNDPDLTRSSLVSMIQWIVETVYHELGVWNANAPSTVAVLDRFPERYSVLNRVVQEYLFCIDVLTSFPRLSLSCSGFFSTSLLSSMDSSDQEK